jgi:sec-independent protein translocase protein TatA
VQKKIPDLAKGLGKGIKNFKEEMKDVSSDEVKTASTDVPKQVVGEETTTVTPKTTTQA